MEIRGSAPCRRTSAAALATLAALLISASATFAETGIPRTASPEGAACYIISPTDGALVSSPVTVTFGLQGMGVAPSGVDKPMTGHHHLIIDAAMPAADMPVPKDANHRHFGGGQTEVTIDLEPGRHTLQLVLGDHLHIPHDPPVASKRITIIVK
jgi:hypothetical protein